MKNSLGGKNHFTDESTSKEVTNFTETFNDHNHSSQNDLEVHFYHQNDTQTIPDFTIQEFNERKRRQETLALE